MIRYAFINNLVYQIYYTLPEIKFPIDPIQVINCFSNCKYMSYQKFAELNNCTVDDIIQFCESKDGCVYYDIAQDRYLILCNQSTCDNNNLGRQRWTCSHEIGHILCKHHNLSAFNNLSTSGLLPPINNKDFELEADYFAATLLAPFPLFCKLDIQSTFDIRKVFGLSNEASAHRYKQYFKWKSNHRKTAWENDMLHLYKSKFVKS